MSDEIKFSQETPMEIPVTLDYVNNRSPAEKLEDLQNQINALSREMVEIRFLLESTISKLSPF